MVKIINKDNLEIINFDNGEIITIESKNGSGLYYGTNQDGENVRLTRNEIKKLGDINLIDETLEMIHNYENDKVYTNDMLNFFDESEISDQEDFKKVNFVIA